MYLGLGTSAAEQRSNAGAIQERYGCQMVIDMDTSKQHQGKIVKFLADRNFGFLNDIASGESLFFHVDDCLGIFPIEAGQFVSFEFGERNGRKKAVRLRKLEPKQILGAQ